MYFLSGIGVLLAATLWAVSYWQPRYYREPVLVSAGAGNVHLTVDWEPGDFDWGGDGLAWRGWQGIHTQWLPQIRNESCFFALVVPLWIPSVFFGVWFGLEHRGRQRAKRRRRMGLCVRCGYDLRGIEKCCPECGGRLGSRGPSRF